MYSEVYQTIDEAYEGLSTAILTEGNKLSSRLGDTIELLNVAFMITNARARLLANSKRAISKKFAVGELSWHLSGSNDLDVIRHYSKSWTDYSDDGETIGGSCYGYNIFRQQDGSSQYQRLRDLLHANPTSRRAVLQLYTADRGLSEDLKDVACTLLLQFFLRNGRLHATAYMRSNDMMYGLPYDIFLFTTLQEMLATELGYQLGTYTHVVGSLHIYEKHIALFRELGKGSTRSSEMQPMLETKSLPVFLALEENRRLSNTMLTDNQLSSVGSFWSELLGYIN